VSEVYGAASAGSGWYKTSFPVNVFVISAVSTTKIRFVQDSGGGPSSQPNVAMLNELQAVEVSAGTDIGYLYDDNGNQTKRTQGTTVEDYGFDYANRLNLYKKTVNSVLQTHFTYRAAPTGDRFSKKDELASTEEAYMYDARDVVGDYAKSGTSFTHQRSYLQGLGIDSKAARISSSEVVHYYVGDALGTVNNVLDGTGAVVNRTVSNAWGEDIVHTQGVADRHGFTQRERDTESGVMHFRARFYDPRLGRFGGKDPEIQIRPTSPAYS
jgi:RHS repeat-associated protein